MKRLLILILALSLGLSVAAQTTGQKITLYIDGVPFELTWVESGSVTVPAHTGYRTLSWDTVKQQYWIDTKGKPENPPLPKVTREVKGFWISQRLTKAQVALYNNKVAPSADVYKERNFLNEDKKSAFFCIRFFADASGLPLNMPLREEWLYARGVGALPDVEEDVPEGIVGWRFTKLNGKDVYYPIYNAADLDWPAQVITYKERDASGKLTNNLKGKWKDYRLWTASEAYASYNGRHDCTTRFIVRDLPAGFGGDYVYGIVQSAGKYGYWCNNRLEIDCEYDEIQSRSTYPNGLFLRKGSKWGFYSFGSRKLVPAVYDLLKIVKVDDAKAKPYFNGTGFEFIQEGRRGFMALDGRVIMPACLRRADLGMDVWLRYVGIASYDYAYEKKAEALRSIRGEFEKTIDFKARQEDPTLQEAYVKEHMQGFEREYLKGVITQTLKDNKDVIDLRWWAYHADEEFYAFYSAVTPYGFYKIHVPIAEAAAFKEFTEKADRKELLKTCYLCVCNGTQQIARITFTLPGGKEYEYVNPDVTPDTHVYPFTELSSWAD